MKPYQPCKLPLQQLDYKRLLPLVGEANADLARYDGLLRGIPNPGVMLSPLTTEEAVLSSRIEGTQATIDEVLEQEAGLMKEGEKYQDIQEIINYRKSLHSAHTWLKDQKPIILQLIRHLHKELLTSTRGQDKTPGEFRKDQNWIGTYGCTIEEASFVPPSPLQLQDCLEDLQTYLTGDDIDVLLQTAIIHAQFELIHPFNDGNGRIGRILIPLFLFRKEKLSQPMFYLSRYLENNRDEYYLRLQNISKANDWDGWIAFFLKAISVQAQDNNQKVTRIMNLYETMKTRIQTITRSQYTIYLLDSIFSKPIFRARDIKLMTHIQKGTLLGLLRQLKDEGILTEIRPASGRSPAILCFRELLNITEGRAIF